MITYNPPVPAQSAKSMAGTKKPKAQLSASRVSAVTDNSKVQASEKLAAGELSLDHPHNKAIFRVESTPDKQGRVQFTVMWFEKGVMYGERSAQYYGVLDQHIAFWRDRRGCIIKIIELPVKPTKKGNK